jgi:hypothetical protein
MLKIVALAALAFALAAMPSVPQRAYACYTQNCGTPDEATTPAVAVPEAKAPAAVACPTANCATPEPAPVQVDNGGGGNAIPEHPARATATATPAAAAVKAAIEAVKKAKANKVGCMNQNC